MNMNILNPRKSLNKAFLKVKPNRSGIEAFKSNLIYLIDNINENETEEFHKNLVTGFLKKAYYDPQYFINTKGRNDLVIHNGNDARSPVGVIIETKKPGKKTEMLKTDNLNVKAVQELVLYFLRERITVKNLEIKYLIATDIYQWFMFDAQIFEKAFGQNKNLVNQFSEFERKGLSVTATEQFYQEIAAKAIEEAKNDLVFTWFDIREYDKPLRNADNSDDNKLIALYKLLSPEHLLKLPFANDSNSLDRSFYAELLHIIGLSEIKAGSKKVIHRSDPALRNPGSLLENAITQLESLDKISRLNHPQRFGETSQERLFNVALELSITWLNRILFLKLLEAQLISYHRGDKSFAFLNTEKISDFDDLNRLFFSVLAKKIPDRSPEINKLFPEVPYLNSSLFEPTEIEHSTLFISNLDDSLKLPLFPSTVLKDISGKKKSGDKNSLQYLFEFLDAYDFSSEGSEEIQEENKTLINASVLGLIFEKINGYKDGSIYTPGFITMYMSREAIRRAVIQKFREVKGWNCDDFIALYNKIEERKESNEIVNSLKICDPAVGSGHFLVSAMNELISIKHDLKILTDRNGKRLKEYQVEVVNDELVVTDEDGKLFRYIPGNTESQRVQEALFHEKQTIIENCLFGVDINPNSVKICQLRLWIELLKNAYYKNENGFKELETLPNIDINIKCGNSLISRYPLDADLRKALKGKRWNIDDYRLAVMTYRNAPDKETKRNMERIIAGIKSDFESEISNNDPRKIHLSRLRGEMFNLTASQGLNLYEKTQQEKEEFDRKVQKYGNEIGQLEAEMEEIKNNRIYENAFEWRFEFPEVLNLEGDFIGFDVVIGNPPYIRADELGSLKDNLKLEYSVFNSGGDIFFYFYERAFKVLKGKGLFSFINNTFDKTTSGKSLRQFFTEKYSIHKYIDFSSVMVFEEATTYPIVVIASKNIESFNQINYLKIDQNQYQDKQHLFSEDKFRLVNQNILNPEVWNFRKESELKLLLKLQKNRDLKSTYGKCYYGIKTALNEAFVISKKLGNSNVQKFVFEGKDIKKWSTSTLSKWMIVFECKSTKKFFGDLTEIEAQSKMKESHPEIFDHLLPFEEKAKARFDQGEYWWELRNCAYYDLFERPKIIFPNLQNSNKFALDKSGTYLNAPAVFLPTEDLALLSILNSKTVWYFLKTICVVRNGGYIEVKPQYFEQIPIPPLSAENRAILESKTQEILTTINQNPLADISIFEKEIDQLVYQIYDLTEEEIAIVEND
jgi:hypothetical protein